jgi:hypothetical protein
MERLAVYLALHGATILAVSLVAGLLLHRTIRLGRPVAAWHLAHAGVSSRGVMLMAMAPLTSWLALTPFQLLAFVWLILGFVWTSTAAMVVAAATGERGLTWTGSLLNRVVFALYVASAVAVVPAAMLLIAGLIARLQAV